MPISEEKLRVYFLAGILVVALTLAFFIFRPFLAPLILAAIFSVVFRPFYKKVLKLLGTRVGFASFVTTLIIIICLLVPLTFLSVKIFDQSRNLYLSLTDGNAKTVSSSVTNIVSGKIDRVLPGLGNYLPDVSDSIDLYAKKGLSWIIQHLDNAISGVAELLFGILIFFIALYYFLRDGERLRKMIFDLSPLDLGDDEIISKKMETAVNSVVKGSLLIALIQGILTAIGFTIFGVPNSVLWGTVAAISALIPAVGTSIVLIPGIIFLFLTGSMFQATGLLIWGVVAVGLIDNFLGAKLMGKGMHLHPLFVLLSVLGGIAFFGPTGLFLGPLTLSLLLAFLSIYSSRHTA